MSTGNTTLKREAAAFALAKGGTVEAAADEAGVSQSTLFRWRQEPAFNARVGQVRGELFGQAAGKLSWVAGAAATTLAQLLASKNDLVRLGAAKAILESALRLREHLDFETRLAAMEQHLADADKTGVSK